MKETGLIDKNGDLIAEGPKQNAVEEKSQGEPLTEADLTDLKQTTDFLPTWEYVNKKKNRYGIDRFGSFLQEYVNNYCQISVFLSTFRRSVSFS